MTDIWINGFDQGEPRTVERQLCLMRDAARRLDHAAGLGDEKLIADARRDLNRQINDPAGVGVASSSLFFQFFESEWCACQ